MECYYSMAKKNFRGYLQGDEVRLKTYFYVLRAEIDVLLALKQAAGEAQYGPRRPRLHAFIQAELTRGERADALPESHNGDVRELDRLLYQTVMA